MEIFDLYDIHGNKLNKTMTRGSKNQPGEYHKVVHIWIRNQFNQYLVQQRNKSTDRNPYQWAPTAGAVTKGELPVVSAIRETYEEIGVLLDTNDLQYKGSFYREDPYSNYIIEVFLVEKDINLDETVIDEREVKDLAYCTKEQIYQMIDEHRFWDFKEIQDYFSILEKR